MSINQDLFEKNMEYLAVNIPALKQIADTHQAQSDLVQDEQGRLNIKMSNGGMFYKFDGKAECDAYSKAFIKNPSRLLIGQPAIVKKDFEEPEPKFGPSEWVTAKYDDRAEDLHFSRYVAEISHQLRENDIKVSDKYLGERPFYLVIFGIGIGQHIQPLLEHFQPRMLILVDENNDNLLHSLRTIDWQELQETAKKSDTTIKLNTDKDPKNIQAALKGHITQSSLMGIDGVHAMLHGPSVVLRQAYHTLMDVKSGNMANFVGFTTDEYNMMKNSFRNLRQGTKRILKNAEEKIKYPVMIVGSGPSLENNIEKLKEIRNKFILFSSGSSLRVLLKNGIKPDFHCNLERAHSILIRHEELAAEGFDLSDIYAVLTTTIWPGIDKFFKGAVYFIRPALSPLGVFADSMEQVLMAEGPQVTNTAFSFARRLAAKEIYLLGVDLGTTNPDIPRANEAWQGIRPRKLEIPIRGNKGRTVFTDMALFQQKETLENQIAKLNQITSPEGVSGICYNLGDGAKIAGAKAIDFNEISIRDEIPNRAEYIDKLYEQFPVYTREKFLGQWTNEVVREEVARFASALIEVINRDGWNNKILEDLESICLYTNKPMRLQYPPRLMRGSLLRIFMHAQTLIQRVEKGEVRDKVIELVKQQLARHIRLLEFEAYGLADQLESEEVEII